ncbi:MAG: hypothetical protein IAI50_13860, partial [Candidatus Eremiobacteraeota bacterium]|nr:hypothetical protein [Candidatus Eremiobacteraeota bacterium]
TLNDPGPNVGLGSGDFVMVERFAGGVHAGESVTTRGAWLTVGRHSSDGFQPNGTLELQPQTARGTRLPPRFFRNTSGVRLQQLDSAMNPFSEAVLQRVIPAPTPDFGPLQIKDAGKTVYMKVGDTIEISLSTGTSPDDAWSLSRLAEPVALRFALGSLSGDEYSGEWTFSMIAPGRTVLTFSDIRPENAGPRHASLSFIFYVSS